ncbi:MAG: SH3 domain-containing protein [Candidatus Peribacteraceae bacterium]|nr:SH3 domain-containing protein [Candidatus Peribacteraceae bacterium]
MVPRRYHPVRRSPLASVRPLIAFLLIASFGILFAGCGGTPEKPKVEEFTFTAEDVARFRELAGKNESGSGVLRTGSGAPHLEGVTGATSSELPVLDLSKVSMFEAIRSGPGATGKDVYRVTNEFLNVRTSPSVTAGQVARLERGEVLTVIEFTDAAWAKVRLADNREGFVAQRYVSKLTSEDRLAQEKKTFDGLYFVNFGFVNVRKEPDAESEKLGEIPGQAFVRPITKDQNWAKVSFQGKDGYVAAKYLSPFLPNFLVRQEEFTLPMLHYRLSQDGALAAMTRHVLTLKQNGVKIITLRSFYDLLLKQEERDARVDPKTVVLLVSDLTAQNVGEASDALRALGVSATFFIQTKQLGLDGITEKMVLNLLANGMDLESGGHTGDDLRSLTNAQVELELAQSRQLLEEYTKRTVVAVGYPEGGVNERVAKYAADTGYLLGVATAPDRTFRREDLLRLPSFVLSPTATDDEVLKIAVGP